MIPATKFSGLVVTANLLFAFWIEYHCFWLLESKSQICAFLSAHLLWVIIFCLNSKWSFFFLGKFKCNPLEYICRIHAWSLSSSKTPKYAFWYKIETDHNYLFLQYKNYKTLAQWWKYINVFCMKNLPLRGLLNTVSLKIIINKNTSWTKHVFVLYTIT